MAWLSMNNNLQDIERIPVTWRKSLRPAIFLFPNSLQGPIPDPTPGLWFLDECILLPLSLLPKACNSLMLWDYILFLGPRPEIHLFTCTVQLRKPRLRATHQLPQASKWCLDSYPGCLAVEPTQPCSCTASWSMQTGKCDSLLDRAFIF